MVLLLVNDVYFITQETGKCKGELDEAVEDFQPIYDIVKKYAPEYDVDAITAEVLEVRENKEK